MAYLLTYVKGIIASKIKLDFNIIINIIKINFDFI